MDGQAINESMPSSLRHNAERRVSGLRRNGCYCIDLLIAVSNLIFDVTDLHYELEFDADVVVVALKLGCLEASTQEGVDHGFPTVYIRFQRLSLGVLPLQTISFLFERFL